MSDGESTRSGPPDGFGSPYRLLSGAVTPRPVAWVSSRGPAGENLAPYSFFTVAAIEPPIVAFSPVSTLEEPKDTLRNAVDTEAFAVNLASVALAEEMNASSATLSPTESEFAHAGLAPAECERVDAPRVSGAPVSLECELFDVVPLGTSTMVFGEVVHVHVDEGLLAEDGKFDVTEYDPVGRLAGNWYATTRDRFQLERPP